MSNWKEYKLSDVCLKIGSGATPRGGQESYLSYGEYTLIRSQNVLDFDFTMKGLAYIDEAQASKLNNVEIKERDILLNITGDSVARVCQVPSKILPARVNQHVAIIRPNRDIINNEYLKYYLLEPKVKDYLLMISSSGGTRNAITKNMLEELVIQAPNLPTQTAIAEILSSLDDKIELNNKINQELETLAQTLFKQWFIDFEFPNEKGEPYKSSGGEMVDSELGEIPKEWGFGSIYEVSNVIYGAPFKSKLFNQEGKGFPLIRIRDMKTFQPQNWTEEVLPKGTKIVAGDLIVGMDAEFRPIFWLGQPAWLNQRLCYFNPKKGFSKLFVREIIRPQLAFFENSSVGTTVIHLGKADIDTFKSIIPEKIIMGLFEEISNSIFEKIINNSKEKNQLTYLRDLLLKKLISGELEINEITN
jgi:type I restriction enzyme S subunit